MAAAASEIVKLAARGLRRKQTGPEKKLWNILRDRRFLGRKFLRQHPIVFTYQFRKRFFIADFYCHEAKLSIEIDGKSHDSQKDYDALRTHMINSLGIQVVRFKNEEIENDIHKVLGELKRLVEKLD